MNENYFGFDEAIYCLKCGQMVQININGKLRRYFKDDDGNIICEPNGKEYLRYKIKNFKIDAVMSDKWELCH